MKRKQGEVRQHLEWAERQYKNAAAEKIGKSSPVTIFVCGREFCKDGQSHQWDGPERIFDGGCGSSSTCSKCGLDAMSYDLMCAP